MLKILLKDVASLSDILLKRLLEQGYKYLVTPYDRHWIFSHNRHLNPNTPKKEVGKLIGLGIISEDYIELITDVLDDKDVPGEHTLEKIGFIFRHIGTFQSEVLTSTLPIQDNAELQFVVLSLEDICKVLNISYNFIGEQECGIKGYEIDFDHYWEVDPDITRYIFYNDDLLKFSLRSLSDEWENLQLFAYCVEFEARLPEYLRSEFHELAASLQKEKLGLYECLYYLGSIMMMLRNARSFTDPRTG